MDLPRRLVIYACLTLGYWEVTNGLPIEVIDNTQFVEGNETTLMCDLTGSCGSSFRWLHQSDNGSWPQTVVSTECNPNAGATTLGVTLACENVTCAGVQSCNITFAYSKPLHDGNWTCECGPRHSLETIGIALVRNVSALYGSWVVNATVGDTVPLACKDDCGYPASYVTWTDQEHVNLNSSESKEQCDTRPDLFSTTSNTTVSFGKIDDRTYTCAFQTPDGFPHVIGLFTVHFLPIPGPEGTVAVIFQSIGITADIILFILIMVACCSTPKSDMGTNKQESIVLVSVFAVCAAIVIVAATMHGIAITNFKLANVDAKTLNIVGGFCYTFFVVDGVCLLIHMLNSAHPATVN